MGGTEAPINVMPKGWLRSAKRWDFWLFVVKIPSFETKTLVKKHKSPHPGGNQCSQSCPIFHLHNAGLTELSLLLLIPPFPSPSFPSSLSLPLLFLLPGEGGGGVGSSENPCVIHLFLHCANKVCLCYVVFHIIYAKKMIDFEWKNNETVKWRVNDPWSDVMACSELKLSNSWAWFLKTRLVLTQS